MTISRDAFLSLVVLVGIALAHVLAQHEAHASPAATSSAHASPAPRPLDASHEGQALRDGRRMDPNRASAGELELLPGVGPSLAQRIVQTRERTGGFVHPADLLRVKGVGKRTLEKLVPFLKFDSEHLEHTTDSDVRLGD